MNGNSKEIYEEDTMQENNNNGENYEDKCGRILDSFDKIRQQAIVAYNEINGDRLNNYVSKIFNLTHDQQHNEWKQTHFLWLYPKGYPNNGILPYDDYTQPIPVEQLHHLRKVDRQMLENELTELFKRMNLIAIVAKKIENIIQAEKNAHRKYGRNHRSVQNYFKTQADMADDVIKEVEYAFRQIGLKKPELNEPINVTDQDLKSEVIHWVVTREHLKLLNYVRSAFEEIRKNECL
ncbi:uncharacterized protein LOC129619113 [Condylostylus longicornis]|uniref:uncharacterized protein LOC129619113 n=1 Tax=Condylostylus longicornis TaxID=2530218 RepID=UPI00244DA392|nr:uncharacterized protein LOC129619113 [Condylostylus longicornis]